ncbi:MAG: hypothetical protein K2I17_06190 [Clostridia bacterium]|nr:hypothetical protein [Clostridia bacterium]
MKNIISAIVTAFTVLTLCICLAACSDGAEGNSVVGTYKFSSATMYGEEIKVGDEYMGITVDSDFYVLNMKDDNTFIMEVNFIGGEDTESGAWKERDGKYFLTFAHAEEFEYEAKISGNTLTLGLDEMNIIFKK